MKLFVPRFILRVWAATVLLVAAPMAWSLELPAGPLTGLKSEEFRKREAAQAELLDWARDHEEPAKDELYRYTRVADDPEVRERCLAVLRVLVNDDYMKDGEGYIGIRMMDELANVPGDPAPRQVIRVMQVVADSAARRAGLQLNDLIAALDGQEWREGVASLSFTDQIRKKKPNAKVTLKVLRAGKLMDIEVKLGRRPAIADAPLFGTQTFDPEVAEQMARDAYFRRWLENRKSSK